MQPPAEVRLMDIAQANTACVGRVKRLVFPMVEDREPSTPRLVIQMHVVRGADRVLVGIGAGAGQGGRGNN